MEGILIVLTIFGCIFGSVYVYLTTRNKERLALIANGANAELFKTKSNVGSGYLSFKIGLFLIGIAFGIGCGYFLHESGMDEGPAFLSMIFLFGGIGLVVSFLLQGKFEKK